MNKKQLAKTYKVCFEIYLEITQGMDIWELERLQDWLPEFKARMKEVVPGASEDMLYRIFKTCHVTDLCQRAGHIELGEIE